MGIEVVDVVLKKQDVTVSGFSQGALSIASAGDFNADGVGDLVIGDPDFDDGRGIAYVLEGYSDLGERVWQAHDMLVRYVVSNANSNVGSSVTGL